MKATTAEDAESMTMVDDIEPKQSDSCVQFLPPEVIDDNLFVDQVNELLYPTSKDNSVQTAPNYETWAHETSARRLGKAYWKHGATSMRQNEQSTRRIKFESSALLVKNEEQMSENQGVGLELECFGSFLPGSIRTRAIKEYILRKKQEACRKI